MLKGETGPRGHHLAAGPADVGPYRDIQRDEDRVPVGLTGLLHHHRIGPGRNRRAGENTRRRAMFQVRSGRPGGETLGNPQPSASGGQIRVTAGVAVPGAVVPARDIEALVTGAARAGQAEDEGSVRQAVDGAGLDGRGADVLEGDLAEDLPQALADLVEEGQQGLRGTVAPGDAGTAGAEDHLDLGIGDPAGKGRPQVIAIVTNDLLGQDLVARGRGGLLPVLPGGVLVRAAAVRDGQDRDVQWQESGLDNMVTPGFLLMTRGLYPAQSQYRLFPSRGDPGEAVAATRRRCARIKAPCQLNVLRTTSHA